MSISRLLLEFLRLDVSLVNGVNINQVFMVMIAVSVALYFTARRRAVQKL
jgi:prolipoprotein diacylglyceryltransferase